MFAGGDHSFLVLNSEKPGTVDFRLPDHTKQILTLTLPKLAACQVFKDSDVVNQVSLLCTFIPIATSICIYIMSQGYCQSREITIAC